MAIALDNSQLYSSLEQKAAEIARLKDFSENIVESLNVGVLAVDLDGVPGVRPGVAGDPEPALDHAGLQAATAGHPHAPNAALLIDFDNVTMGIRSDLASELRNLLSSEIIKGKVAVQRAYADWRRYPQYIVPLSESSIDLIFAPAHGANKKNATDIRLAELALGGLPEGAKVVGFSANEVYAIAELIRRQRGGTAIGP